VSADPADDAVLLERRGDVAVLTLNRPDARNALGRDFSAVMNRRLDEVEGDPGVGAVVLTGAGSVFCGGGDLAQIMSSTTSDPVQDFSLIRGYNRVVSRIRRLDQPTVAAVNGPAVGGGAALAMACDMAVAAQSGSYVFAFGRIGLAGADMGCAYLLPRLVGPVRAAHLMLSAGTLDADQGAALGVFLDVVPDGQVVDAAVRLATPLAAGPRAANAATTMALRRGETTDLDTVLDYEAYLQTVQFAHPDHKSRLAGFRGRRPDASARPTPTGSNG
jgi:enoyl-CoA hydratase/carnithine racemase